jgi:hypothetical protein
MTAANLDWLTDLKISPPSIVVASAYLKLKLHRLLVGIVRFKTVSDSALLSVYLLFL